MKKSYEDLLLEIEQLKLENSALKSTSEDFEILYINLSEHNSIIENELDENLKTLQEASKKIFDSVYYAKRIQNAMLSKISDLKSIFPESFVFLESKDIVSGDFYWFQKVKNQFLFATVDCTGHGVPGAFMSIMGIALLNEIARNENIREPGIILEIMRRQVKASFKKTTKVYQATDGMELAFCAFNLENMKLQFSGANNPLVLIRNGELTVFKGTRNPIGSYIKEIPFKNNIIDIKKDDVFYMFSDGFRDQINSKMRKYTMRKFKNFLLNIHKKKMIEQKQDIGNELNRWNDTQHQTDDVLVVGIKIP